MCGLISTNLLLSGCAINSGSGAEDTDASQLRFVGFGTVKSVNAVPIEDRSYIAEAGATGAVIGTLLGGLLLDVGKSDETKFHHRSRHPPSNNSASDDGTGMLIGGIAGGAIGAAVGAVRKLSTDTPVQRVQLTVYSITEDNGSWKGQTQQILQPVSAPAIVPGDTVRLFSDGVNTRAVMHSMGPRSRAAQ
ncbi:hypothetical protein FQZ97_1008020 [compost metagenome]